LSRRAARAAQRKKRRAQRCAVSCLPEKELSVPVPDELSTKLERVRALMEARGVAALWLRRVENVAWITGGVDIAVNTADAFGVASVVVTRDTCELWTNTIEAPRLRAEDHLHERGFTFRVTPWYLPGEQPPGAPLGVDFPTPGADDLTGALAALRTRLLPVEQARFRTMAINCAEAMQRTANRVSPGMSEAEAAAALSYETRRFNITPIVVLIAADERVYQVRHPLPTDRIIDRYAMLVLCGRWHGLVCSITRLVHFGALPDDLRRKMDACAEVDAAMIAASQPGATLGDIFRITQDAYARAGFDGEWKLHHQGGVAGYTPREILATPGEPFALEAGMICAWNPSITGTKSEDSVLVRPGGQTPEILTAIYGWPVREVPVNGRSLARPLIMEMG